MIYERSTGLHRLNVTQAAANPRRLQLASKCFFTSAYFEWVWLDFLACTLYSRCTFACTSAPLQVHRPNVMGSHTARTVLACPVPPR